MDTPARLRTDRKATLVISLLMLLSAIGAVAITAWFSYRGASEQNASLSLLSDVLSGALMLVTVGLSASLLLRQRRALDEKRFRAITENARQITVIFNEDGSHRYASPALKLLRNVPHTASITPQDYLHPDDLDAVHAAIAKACSGTPHITLEAVRCLRHGGKWRASTALWPACGT